VSTMARPNRTRQFRFALRTLLLVVTAVVVGFGAIVVSTRGGVSVSVHDLGPDPLNQVVVHVTGRSYRLGDIAAGDSRRVTVNPTSESHVAVEFVDARGSRTLLTVDCYLEPGYKGSLDIQVKGNKLAGVQDRGTPNYFPKQSWNECRPAASTTRPSIQASIMVCLGHDVRT